MHLCFFVTETCKFDALDKRLKSGDVFDQTQEKKTLSFTVLIVVLLFYFPRCKNQAFLQNYRSAIYSYYLDRFHSVPASTTRFYREHHATAIFEAVCFSWELHLLMTSAV